MSHVYCPECGFQNPEAANFCAKCGSLLVKDDGGEQTISYTPEEVERGSPAPRCRICRRKGPALVVRSGGGRAGESFLLYGGADAIGRSPECEVFLDDVTVSRRHAVDRARDGDTFTIEDLGSLNGTFVNRGASSRRRELEDDDELQIGKYRLTFLRR